MALGNSSRKLSISRTWWFVSNFSDIFFEASVSSTLSLNLTETDSISVVGNSFLNNVKTNVESIPELNETPIFFELGSMLLEIEFLINFSIICSGLEIGFIVKSFGVSFSDIVCKFVE